MFRLAILPSVVLFLIVWKADKIEKEPPKLLLKLFIWGALTVISAVIIELAGETPLGWFFSKGSLPYVFIDNFILVALIEEGGKYFVMKKLTWDHPAFNYTFDSVVYAVTVSLGFATFENILYVVDEDISVAVLRALLSVPGHVMFAIFMGYYYGLAKCAQQDGQEGLVKKYLKKALVIPTLLHGFYDFCLSTQYGILYLAFVVFEIVMVITSIKRFRALSREDREIREQAPLE